MPASIFTIPTEFRYSHKAYLNREENQYGKGKEEK